MAKLSVVREPAPLTGVVVTLTRGEAALFALLVGSTSTHQMRQCIEESRRSYVRRRDGDNSHDCVLGLPDTVDDVWAALTQALYHGINAEFTKEKAHGQG